MILRRRILPPDEEGFMNIKKSAVILAGGEGKRMKSDKPKVLSEVACRPMLRWVIDAVKGSGIEDICVVTGYKSEDVREYLKTLPFEVDTAFQSQRLGTGHAVMSAGDFLERHRGENVLILNGDAPFINSETIHSAFLFHAQSSCCTIVSADVDNPEGYGRIIHEFSENGVRLDELSSIVEEKEADDEQRKITEVNSGVYWFDVDSLISALKKLKASELTGEYYLTDTIEIIKSEGKKVTAFKTENSDLVLGANDPEQLAELNRIAEIKNLTKY